MLVLFVAWHCPGRDPSILSYCVSPEKKKLLNIMRMSNDRIFVLVNCSFKTMTSNVWYSHPASETDRGQTSGRLPERAAPNTRPCKGSQRTPKINSRVGEMLLEGQNKSESSSRPQRCVQLSRNSMDAIHMCFFL